MLSRIKGFFEINGSISPCQGGVPEGRGGLNQKSLSTLSLSEERESQNVDENKLQEASIALWLLNSEIPNPKKEDILNIFYTKSINNES